MNGFLIADDFGLGRGHDAVILRLLAAGRLAGTSVMIDGALAPSDLAELRDMRRQGRQVGLHLTLTHAFAPGDTAPSISTLIRQALTGRLSTECSATFRRQAARFVQLFGSPPDFYDGHQHCHCLPGLAGTVAALPRNARTWLRVPSPRGAGLVRNIRTGGIKTLIVAAMGWNARRIWRRVGWPVNADFSGFMDLSRPESVRRDFPALLAAAPPGCLVMVHPGDAEDPQQCINHAGQARAVEAVCLFALTNSYAGELSLLMSRPP